MTFAAGQCWRYRAPEGFETSRLIVGAVIEVESGGRLICCSVTDAPQRYPDGAIGRVNIPFLPLTEAAFAATVTDLERVAEPLAEFAPSYAAWVGDARGLSYFTVPFEGWLDRLIARQMAEIVGVAV